MLMLLTDSTDHMISFLLPGVESGSAAWFFACINMAAWPLITGFIIDMAAGDPHWLPHPIRAIGWLIRFVEKLLRKERRSLDFDRADRDSHKQHKKQLRLGLLLAISVPLLTAIIVFALLLAAWKIHFAAGLILETIFCWLILAARSLKTETSPIQEALEHGDLAAARERLSWLVGRDTAVLNEEEIAKATIETIAENTNDGVVAPLFYLAIGGPVLGMVYKAINTLDSMVGYRNERYFYFGRASARLDDTAGFIPARIAALLMLLSTRALHFPAGRAWQIFRRDRKKHLSPNSAQTESVCAGALGIELGGSHIYHGQLIEKPCIGDAIRPAVSQDISRAQQIMLLTSIMAGITLWLLSLAVFSLTISLGVI